MKKLLVAGIVAIILSGCSASPYFVKRQGNIISFYAKIPKAKKVYFVSSASNFQKVKAVEVGDGLWKTSVAYKSNLIKYFYIVDGKIFVPPCKSYEKDDFGGKDCVYVYKNM